MGLQLHGQGSTAIKFQKQFGPLVEKTLGYAGGELIEQARRHPYVEFVAGCTLHPGEALYMPPWTWHDVFTTKPSISLGTRFAYDKRHPKSWGGAPPIQWHTASKPMRTRYSVPHCGTGECRTL